MNLIQKEINFSASFNRPENNTTYTAEDAVNDGANNISFTTVGGDPTLSGGQYYIKSLRIATNNATVTNASFRLYILNTVQTPVIADNAQQTLLYANISKVDGFIDFSLTTGGVGSDSAEAYITDINIPVVLSGNTISGYLVAKQAYVPTSGQSFYINLATYQTVL